MTPKFSLKRPQLLKRYQQQVRCSVTHADQDLGCICDLGTCDRGLGCSGEAAGRRRRAGAHALCCRSARLNSSMLIRPLCTRVCRSTRSMPPSRRERAAPNAAAPWSCRCRAGSAGDTAARKPPIALRGARPIARPPALRPLRHGCLLAAWDGLHQSGCTTLLVGSQAPRNKPLPIAPLRSKLQTGSDTHPAVLGAAPFRTGYFRRGTPCATMRLQAPRLAPAATRTVFGGADHACAPKPSLHEARRTGIASGPTPHHTAAFCVARRGRACRVGGRRRNAPDKPRVEALEQAPA